KTNMHTVQVAAEDYSVQHDGTYSAIMDGSHIADLLPPSYKNPFSGGTGPGVAWEDRATFAADASPVSGIVSYSDSATAMYNIKGYGKATPINVTLTYGQ